MRALGFLEKHRSPYQEARMRVIVMATLALILKRRDHHQINRFRDECRRAHSDAGEIKAALPSWRCGARTNLSCRKEFASLRRTMREPPPVICFDGKLFLAGPHSAQITRSRDALHL